MPHSKNIWECLFVVITVPNRCEKLVVGNIYRSPRDRIELLDKFIKEYTEILNFYDKYDHVCVFGDYNLDLLRCAADRNISNFFEETCSAGFFPKITLPTRITEHRMTLIDNVFCKFSKSFAEIKTGILTNQLSDHCPYFASVCFPDCHASSRNSRSSLATFRPLTTKEQVDFKTTLSKNSALNNFKLQSSTCPLQNCDTLINILDETRAKVQVKPPRKPSKKNSPRSPWITKGLVKSICIKDSLYKKLKNVGKDSPRYTALKIQLRNHKKILRRSCRNAKRLYYSRLFEKHKHDSRKTWSIINKLVNGENIGNNLPDIFLINQKEISDPKVIANELNLFFLGIAHKMVDNLEKTDVNFETYLGPRPKTTFSFLTINRDTVSKAIDALKCKSTMDCYGLSSELIKICKF